MFGNNPRLDYDRQNMLYKQALYRCHLEYPFAKGKAYKVELYRELGDGHMAIIVRNKRTNEYVGSTLVKEIET